MLRIPPLSCAFLPLLAGLAHSQTIPAGWRAVSAASSWDSPGVTCANHELTPWRVDVDSARSVLTIQPGSERPHTDSVPFQGGMLAGFDHGEFGGSVEWHGAGTVEKIGDENPVVFIRGSHAVYLLAGLAHMGSNEGRLLRITKTGAAWKIETLLQLGFAPTALFPFSHTSPQQSLDHPLSWFRGTVSVRNHICGHARLSRAAQAKRIRVYRRLACARKIQMFLVLLPNTRLKLSAPAPKASSGHADIRCASLSFVNLSARRRSLSAIR